MNFKKALLTVVALLVLCSSSNLLLAQSRLVRSQGRAQQARFSNKLNHILPNQCCPPHQEYVISPEYLTTHEHPENFVAENHPDLRSLNKSATGGWVSLGPEGGFIYELVMHPTDHNTLYAQTYGNPTKIFKSTDGGANWALIGYAPTLLYALALDPNNPSIMYGVSGYRVYKSTDEGVTWTVYQIDTKWFYEPSIQINPNNSQIIYIGGYSYANNKWSMILYKSTDGGLSWSSSEVLPTFYSQAYSYCFTMNQSNPEELYFGGVYYDNSSNYYPALFKSTDGGASWTDKSKGLERLVYDVKIDPTNSNKIYACNYSYIYRSSDGGSNWQKNSDWAYGNKLAIDPQNPQVIYAGYYGNIFRSTNSGVNWSYYTNGLRGQCQSLIVDHTNSNQLYYGSNVGVFKSVNNGSDWVAVNSGLVASKISAMALASSDPKKIYIEFYYNAVYKTINSGDSWNQLPEFSSCGYVGALAVDHNTPDVAFALEESG